MKKIFIMLMALLLVATALLFTGCNKDSDSNEEYKSDIFFSKDSLFAYTLNEKNEATLVDYSGKAANLVINRIDGRYKIVAIGNNAFA